MALYILTDTFNFICFYVVIHTEKRDCLNFLDSYSEGWELLFTILLTKCRIDTILTAYFQKKWLGQNDLECWVDCVLLAALSESELGLFLTIFDFCRMASVPPSYTS